MAVNSKDSEVRARVPNEMYEALSRLAQVRGEQLPVILREAITEYLARRAAGSDSKYPVPGSDALMQILREQPDVAQTLIALGNLMKSSFSPGLTAADKVVELAVAHAQSASKPPLPATTSVKYGAARRRAKKPTS